MRTFLFCLSLALIGILMFGFDAWRLLTPDIIPGDHIGFGVPLWFRLVIFVMLVGIAIYSRNLVYLLLFLPIGFVLGIHVSFSQVGPLAGYLFGFVPLGVEVQVCKAQEDNAMKIVDLRSTNTATLARFQNSCLLYTSDAADE